jgi:transcription termination/antitermination protein NusG
MGLKGRSRAAINIEKEAMDQNNQSWRVVYVASRREKKVASLLEQCGYTYYLPLVEKIRVWSDRKKKVQAPLFNGYVFVKPSAAERDFILQIPGVVKYIRYNEADAEISDEEIKSIQSLIKAGYDIDGQEGIQSFKAGELVKITSGPLKDYEGEIILPAQGSHVFLILRNMGHCIKIKLPNQVLKKITANR